MKKSMIRILLAGLLLNAMLVTSSALAQGAKQEEKSLFITEAYYRIQWGHFEEFMELFKRNHYPILVELEKRGVIESMEAAFPINHASEESRWDFRLRISLRDTDRMASEFPKVSKLVFPDQIRLAKEEQRRFSLLTAHTDIVIRLDDMSSW